MKALHCLKVNNSVTEALHIIILLYKKKQKQLDTCKTYSPTLYFLMAWHSLVSTMIPTSVALSVYLRVLLQFFFFKPTIAEHLTPDFLLHDFSLPKQVLFFLNCRFSCCLIRENRVAVLMKSWVIWISPALGHSGLRPLKACSVYTCLDCVTSENEHWYQVCYFEWDEFYASLKINGVCCHTVNMFSFSTVVFCCIVHLLKYLDNRSVELCWWHQIHFVYAFFF